MMKRLQSELMRVTNLKTGLITYYVSKCDVFTRISKEDYNKRYDEADGFSCAWGKSNKTHRRSYITTIYEYNMKDKA